MQTPEPIGLAELLARIKADLLSIPEDNIPIFSIDEIKVELKVTVSREAKGGINVQVVQLGGSGRRDDVQTVTVTLSPFLTKQERLQLWDPERLDAMRSLLEQAGGASIDQG